MTETEWIAHVSAWRQSGETASEYCERRGLKVGSLRYWSSRFRREQREQKTEGAERAATHGLRMARVLRADSDPGPLPSTDAPRGLRVWVGQSCVEVSAGFDAETLGRLLQVLGGEIR